MFHGKIIFIRNLSKKYSEEDINLLVIFQNDKSGKYIDRFNSRIIFPVNNINRRYNRFWRKNNKRKKLAKYINSPETEFYKKGNIIFNLDKAKDVQIKY